MIKFDLRVLIILTLIFLANLCTSIYPSNAAIPKEELNPQANPEEELQVNFTRANVLSVPIANFKGIFTIAPETRLYPLEQINNTTLLLLRGSVYVNPTNELINSTPGNFKIIALTRGESNALSIQSFSVPTKSVFIGAVLNPVNNSIEVYLLQGTPLQHFHNLHRYSIAPTTPTVSDIVIFSGMIAPSAINIDTQGNRYFAVNIHGNSNISINGYVLAVNASEHEKTFILKEREGTYSLIHSFTGDSSLLVSKLIPHSLGVAAIGIERTTAPNNGPLQTFVTDIRSPNISRTYRYNPSQSLPYNIIPTDVQLVGNNLTIEIQFSLSKILITKTEDTLQDILNPIIYQLPGTNVLIMITRNAINNLNTFHNLVSTYNAMLLHATGNQLTSDKLISILEEPRCDYDKCIIGGSGIPCSGVNAEGDRECMIDVMISELEIQKPEPTDPPTPRPLHLPPIRKGHCVSFNDETGACAEGDPTPDHPIECTYNPNSLINDLYGSCKYHIPWNLYNDSFPVLLELPRFCVNFPTPLQPDDENPYTWDLSPYALLLDFNDWPQSDCPNILDTAEGLRINF